MTEIKDMDPREIAVALTSLEVRARQVNLFVTARAINAAVRAIGYEWAGARDTALYQARKALE